MKIALLTWFHFSNYGTALQVYALTSVLQAMGHQVDVINYKPGFFKPRTIQDMSPRSVAKWVKGKLVGVPDSPPPHKSYENSEREELFASFISEHLTFTSECRTLSDLCDLNGKYDAFVCGSDQIWSPNNFNPRYFLDFVASADKMIAYAPSIGLGHIADGYVAEQMRELIGRFKHLSVREAQGAALIRELTGAEARVVLDPTLLLGGDGWERLIGASEKPSDEAYILVYMLGNNPLHWEKVYADAIKRGTAVKVIPVFEHDINRDGCIKNAVGPMEFLALVKNAEAVYTDSFHGMALSLMLGTSFVPFERFSSKDPVCQNSRVYNLLSVCGMEQRLVTFEGECRLDVPVDPQGTADAIAEKRRDSEAYLKNALETVSVSTCEVGKRVLSTCPLCCGCGACKNTCPVDAINLKTDANGFIVAEVDEEKCIGCGKCTKVCPMLGKATGRLVTDNPLYSFKNNDPEILRSSTSGGFAYTLSKLLIENGYSVVGCAFDEESQRARHILVSSVEELSALQGSKYMQSDFASVIPQILSCSTPLAVFGTPCQVSGIRKLLSGRENTVYIDLICHGVPSYNLYRKYKRRVAKKYGLKENGIVTKFRYKDKGWRTIRLHSTDGEKSVCFDQWEDMYFRAFETGGCYSAPCYECRYRDRSDADIRIGDYWGPRFENDRTGVNMVSVFTEVGEQMMRALSGVKGCNIGLQSANDYSSYQQTLNIPEPLFYNEYLRRLSDEREDISGILRRYCAPFEKFEPDRKKRLMRFIMTATDENLYRRRRSRRK